MMRKYAFTLFMFFVWGAIFGGFIMTMVCISMGW